METKANHVVVGVFALIAVAGAIAFILWMAKVDIDREYAYYDVLFEGGISGLSTGGDVRFSGVKVGRVTRIALDPARPGSVRARIEVAAELPVRADSRATLNFKGVTGVSYVQISGGSPGSPLLEPAEGQTVATIKATESDLQRVVSGAPELVEQARVLVVALGNLFNQENRDAVGDILGNVQRLTGRIADQAEQLDDLISNLNTISTELAQASTHISGIADNVEALMARAESTLEAAGKTVSAAGRTLGTVDTTMKTADRALRTADQTLKTAGGTLARIDEILGTANQALTTAGDLMQDELAKLMVEARSSAASIASLAGELNGLVAEARPGLVEFSGEGLLQFNRFVSDARQLIVNIDRVAQRLESDPARFLLGRQEPEYEPKK